MAQGAAQLKAAGSSEPLHVRRAQALGDLARSAQTPTPSTLPFPDPDHNDDNKTTGQDGNGQDGIGQDGSGREGSGRPRWGGGGVPRTGVKIYIHLNHTALRCTCTTPPEKTPKTPATGTALSSSAFDGAALPGTGPGTPASTATTGTAPSNPLLGGTALGEGLPGGSFVEYFIKGPGAGPGPGVTPAPEGPAPGIYTPPAADPCGTAAPPVADPPGPSTASEASTPREASTARDASSESGAGFDGFLMPDVAREEDRLGEVGRVDGTGMATAVLAPETIRGWFTRPRAFDCPGVKISVQQVLDPLEFISSQAYEVPQRARQATILTDRSCVFPYCHAIAERADCDHITPYDQGGPSCTCNLAALCRFHHRLKTHGQHHPDHKWTYAPLGQGKYVWHGPNDIHLLRTPTGTHVLPGDIFTTRPAHGDTTPGIRYPDGTTSGFDEHHPAFAAVTDPLALPNANPDGHPRPLPEVTLMQQRLRERAKDPAANTYYQRYAAPGKHLARPEIQYCELPPQTTTAATPEDDKHDDTDENPGPFYNPGPPPF